MDYKSKYKKYKNKFKIQKSQYHDVINLIHQWWEAASNHKYDVLKSMMSPAIQIVNVDSNYIGSDELIKNLVNYKILANYHLKDFKLTKDIFGNIIVTYKVDNLRETTSNLEKRNNVRHSVVFNKNLKIINWNNFTI